MEKIDENILEKVLERMRASGKLQTEAYDRYLKDISVSILGFVYKIKIKMITSEICFFADYYLPSNGKMTNFREKDARYVFKMLIDYFYEYCKDLLALDELSNIEAVKKEDEIIITSSNWFFS
ncbi:hypothetical protein POZ03_01065 [Bacteroides uniformis]|uniref:hypothetical protein n=1 Tax=Bacteroides uniformis TaxID=820 RepID=UPI00233E840B|nr:hypothetical protein [Bacteroides uniformis]MDC1809047.1 hypothetical protein [Bacteroides uniformis]